MTAKMTAVGYAASLPISDERSLFEFETPVPRPGDRDLLVRVQAVSVNPVDVKVRMRKQGTRSRARHPRMGCGRHRRGGGHATAGCSSRATTSTTPATSIVPAPMRPSTWSTSASSAASRSRSTSPRLPRCRSPRITAWELLFDRIGVKRGEGADRRSLLIVGGAGGVGSIAIQLARKLTGLSVIATASRPETQDWVREPRRAPRRSITASRSLRS